MADALLGAVFDKLLSLAQNELATISGIKGKAQKLSRNLELIKAVVEDAEEKQITDKPIKVWLQHLKDAVYVLDDILDECSIESLRLAGLSSLKPKNIKFRYQIGNRLKEITSRFDEIAEGKAKLLLQERVMRGWSAEEVEERKTGPAILESQIYGRLDDKKKIVEFLLSKERFSDFLSVYPIVGLGGMGKTTLSQMVYNDDGVSSNFNPKIWICVSDNFSVKGILCSIVKSITEEEKYNTMDLPVIQRKVQELLQSKRYLLVLDDVWNKSQQMELGLSQVKWDNLKSVLLSCGSKGASILVSTRDMEVAEIMGTSTSQPHRLEGLSEDDCWLLFKQYAFGANKEERAELVAVGKEIAKKCKGSPLAARALGGLLHLRNEEKELVEVMESRLWDLQDERCILPALRLSYFHLTPPLRQCFAFCAIFPKDTKIIKEDLIDLWMANGFISSTKNKEVEDVGNSIWNELCRKSFFQDISTNYYGKTTFKMHDLVHDLAESFMGKECVILDNANITNLPENTHHVFFDCQKDLSFNEGTFDKVDSLRTLYQFNPWEKYDCLPTHCSLRVLQTSSSNLSSLGSLIHLRYLEIYNVKLKTLPDSIYSLRKLEILKLKSLRKLTCLPKHLSRLQNLRHLVIESCSSLSCMFPNIGKLSGLRTLSVYIVSSKTGHSLAELHDLKLGGDLHIKGLEHVCSLSEAQEGNLKGKSGLHKLFLSWGSSKETRSHATNTDGVLEGLQPHSNLKELRIDHYAGLKSPSWIGLLSNLVELELSDCQNMMQLSSISKLPSLRRLVLEGMENMKYIDDDESYDGVEVRAFPSLEDLRLDDLPKLERLLKVEKGEMFARVSVLQIKNCPKLELPSCIPSLTSLTLSDCTNEQLRPVSHFTGLTSLFLRNGHLTSFPVELFNNLNALESLEISGFDELECLQEQGWEGLHSLRHLQIWECPRLRSLPDGFQHLNAMEKLEIHGCNELECLPEQGWEGLHSLQILRIRECPGLRSLLDGILHLNALEQLEIDGCNELECLPEQGWEGLHSLRYLRIWGCPGLRSLPDGILHLNALEQLKIHGCNELECLPEQGWEGLHSLRTLRIRECPGLRSLLDDILHLNALEQLEIDGCNELECLPEQGWEGLHSLRYLRIWGCPGLRSLPDGFQHLSALERLIIEGCPELKERCKEGTGEDWDKIAHVPDVYILLKKKT